MIDITNKPFGKLIALEFSHLTKSRHAVWKCKCECGNDTLAETRQLRNGTRVSCGCEQYKVGSNSPTWKGYGDLSLTHFNKIKADAKKRNIKFNVTLKFLWDLFEKQSRKCVISGEDITLRSKVHTSDGTASLDRIDSNVGYVENNVQWVHKDVNFMKSNLTMNRFLEVVKKIHTNFKLGI
jgi:hypothetical protein